MGYTLTITVGGLCMLVQKDSGEKGLYILMPETKNGHMQHCPVMITEAGQLGGDHLLVPLKADEDLTYLAAHEARLASQPANVLEISRYGGAKVDPAVFTGPRPKSLARLIRLPLGSTMEAVGETACLQVPDGSTYVSKDFVGSVRITVRVTNTDDLKIAGKTLIPKPPANPTEPRTLGISIIHAPREEWECKRRATVKDATATHVAAYFDLLRPGASKPEIKYGRTYDGTPGHLPHGKLCPVQDEPAPAECPRHPFWIDPANCTVGTGDA